MGVIAQIFKQAGTLAAPAKQMAAGTKVILGKNVMVVGDDLAVKTERSLGIKPEREGHVLLRSSLGAVRNRLIIWPIALGISVVFPAAITPALMLGSTYLCYEVAHTLAGLWHKDDHHEDDKTKEPQEELSYEEFEQQKINSFVRTDFVMAMETTAIGMGQIAHTPLLVRGLSLGAAGMLLLAGVSASVFGLLKIDDAGHYLSKKEGDGIFSKAQRGLGDFILKTEPALMKGISTIGVAAMLLVGGNILVHGIPQLAALSHMAVLAAHAVPLAGPALAFLAPLAVSSAIGLGVGFAAMAGLPYAQKAYDFALKPIVDPIRNLVSNTIDKVTNLFRKKPGPAPKATQEQETKAEVSAIESKTQTPATRPVLPPSPPTAKDALTKAATPKSNDNAPQEQPSPNTPEIQASAPTPQ